MKLKPLMIFAAVSVFALTGCAGGSTDVVSAETESVEMSASEESTAAERLQIEVNGQTLSATLENNSSAKALVELIGEDALMLELHDYSGFEKVGDLPETLPVNDEDLDTDAGDLILYQGNQFVLYYDHNSWSLTKLGHVDDISKEDLQALLGDGDVTVTLRVE